MSTIMYGRLVSVSVGEELPCQCEDGNAAGPYAVRIENAISWSTVVIKRHMRDSYRYSLART